MLSSVPPECSTLQCPQASISKGFVLFSGVMPPKSNICLLLEAGGADEPSFLIKDLVDGYAELQRRKERYPNLEDRFLRMGCPVVGRSGSLLWYWLMRPLGLQRTDVACFNVLNCYPGKAADGGFFYPKGPERKRSEATCAKLWLQPLVEWDPTISIVAMHPSAISRDVVPLPMVLRAIERAKQFAAKGERVLLLMGGKAAKHWIGYGENTTRWCCHWQRETELTRRLRAERWQRGMEVHVGPRVKKAKKLTAKDFLKMFHARYVLDEQLGQAEYHMPMPPTLTPEQYAQLEALTVSKPKKVKSQEPVAA